MFELRLLFNEIEVWNSYERLGRQVLSLFKVDNYIYNDINNASSLRYLYVSIEKEDSWVYISVCFCHTDVKKDAGVEGGRARKF